MKIGSRSGLAWMGIVVAILLPVSVVALAPERGELVEAHQWGDAHFGAAAALPPFSFHYGERSSTDLLPSWRFASRARRLDSDRSERTLSWTDPATLLEVRCVVIEYRDYPALEWTVYLKNQGTVATPILADLQAVDVSLDPGQTGEVVLHHSIGAPTKAEDYTPLATTLRIGETLRLASEGGRPSSTVMPYFNLAWRGAGVVGAVGWPGQWAADFRVHDAAGVRIRAGQELTHFRLEPGEEVRTPLIALVFWRGNPDRAHNLWRAWMVAHNLPRPGGQLAPTHLVACSSHQFNEMLQANEENQKHFIDRYLAEGLPIDHWWMDAGWYVNNGSWVNTGTWEVDPKRFPNGLRAITDHAHRRGLKSIVWFEPERVTTNSWLYAEHPDWCLPSTSPNTPGARPSAWRLLDLGNPSAWRWAVDHFDRLITEQGVDLYRQDFNMDPLPHWRAHDGPDRQGLTEIRHVTGYLAFWDELQRRHPTLLIDSCASGGRRNDLETMRRAVPFLRSDFLFEPASQQAHTLGVAYWLPHHGTGTIVGPSALFKDLKPGEVSDYLFRSHMCPTVIACWDVRRTDLDYRRLRELSGQLRRIQPYYYGDYYPLTPHSLAQDVWMAWQFDRPDLRGGVIQAFRRATSTESSLRVHLQGLRPRATYEVENLDGGKTRRTGRELMVEGLDIQLPERPAAAVWVYRR